MMEPAETVGLRYLTTGPKHPTSTQEGDLMPGPSQEGTKTSDTYEQVAYSYLLEMTTFVA